MKIETLNNCKINFNNWNWLWCKYKYKYFLTVFSAISINIWFSNSLYFLFSFLISTHFVSILSHLLHTIFIFWIFIVFYMSLYLHKQYFSLEANNFWRNIRQMSCNLFWIEVSWFVNSSFFLTSSAFERSLWQDIISEQSWQDLQIKHWSALWNCNLHVL